MPTDHRAVLAKIKRFDQLIAYLRDEMNWPMKGATFDELTFDYSADELGIDAKSAAKIVEIKRLRPLSAKQPWGIFFVKFEPKKLPVVALRRILSQVALKKRASANSAERTAWAADDLLFVSNYGEGDERTITFAHFSQDSAKQDLPILKVLGWNEGDTALHLDGVASELTSKLAWPSEENDVHAWRTQWRSAFTVRHGEIIATSKDMSIRLAQLARAICDRIKTVLTIETENGPITKLMKAFREALVHDLDADGFADMYAQTIAYGLLSARIADPKASTTDHFAEHMRTNPFLKELMETFLHVGGRKGKAGRGTGIDFDELGVSEVVELLDHSNMEAIVRDFGNRTRGEDPVIHFYEHFLSAYNKQLKIQRGVFYTPQPVVSYIVRSVHELLQTEFGLADGLADTTTWGEMLKKHPGLKLPLLTDEPGEKRTISPDEPFVQILDPATGTATFLVEVIDVIHHTLMAKWKQQRFTDAQQRAAWNDYVPKHLLPRLHAFELMMAPYAIAHMKIGLKLAETGYRFGAEERARIYLTNAIEPWVKQLPLIDFDALAHEAAAVNEIKRHKRFTVVIGNPPYSHRANFLSPEQRAIIEPYKFIDGKRMKVRGALQLERNLNDDYVKFVRFSQTLIDQVGMGLVGVITNNAYLENLTFPGMRNSLAATFPSIQIVNLNGSVKTGGTTPDGGKDENVFDIQQGVAISILSKPLLPVTSARLYCNAWGARSEKERLLRQGSQAFNFLEFSPTPDTFLFVPAGGESAAEYLEWKALDTIFSVFGTGIMTNRNGLTIGMTRSELAAAIALFLDRSLDDRTVSERLEVKSNALWGLHAARVEIAKLNPTDFFRPIDFRPFDARTIFYHSAAVDNMRRSVMEAAERKGNLTLVVSRQQFKQGFQHVLVTRRMFDECFLSAASREKASGFSLLRGPHEAGDLTLNSGETNLKGSFLPVLGTSEDSSLSTEKFHYIYAVLHSETYRLRYAEELKRGYPRIPETTHLALAGALARLGGELTALHLLESPKLAQPITEFIGGRNPEVEKVSWSKNTVWVDKAQTIGFKGVREDVWKFHIGGYQVCEKWLKDRKGRKLLKADIEHYQKIVVALAETIRLMKEIDKVIEKYGGWPIKCRNSGDTILN